MRSIRGIIAKNSKYKKMKCVNAKEMKFEDLKFKHLASVYSTTIGVEECFLGKRMSTITNNRSKQIAKYLKLIEEKLNSLLVVWLST